jgi:hypothetical protein
LPESKVAAEEEGGPLSQLEHHRQVLQGYGLIKRAQILLLINNKKTA